MKLRLSLIDVVALVRDVRVKCLGKRVVNVYDVDNKTYVFKLHEAGHEKCFLLMESGIRFHLSEFDFDKRVIPSNFCTKLRKHLKSRRLTGVRQLGADRVVDFRFGSDDFECHVLLELYKGGNIILTDASYTILSLLRQYTDAQGKRVAVHETYLDAQQIQPASNPVINLHHDNDEIVAHQISQYLEENAKIPAITRKQRKSRILRLILTQKDSGLEHFGPVLIEHALRQSSISPDAPVYLGQYSSISTDQSLKFVHEIRTIGTRMRQLQEEPTPGYIIVAKDANNSSGCVARWPTVQSTPSAQPTSEDIAATSNVDINNYPSVSSAQQKPINFTEPYTFRELTPVLLAQHHDAAYMQFPSFDKAVAIYFAQYANFKRDEQKLAAMKTAELRVQRVRQDQQSRVDALKGQACTLRRQATALESYLDPCDRVITTLRHALAKGISWSSIEEMVREEQCQQNAIALLIANLRLREGKAVLQLPDLSSTSDEKSILGLNDRHTNTGDQLRWNRRSKLVNLLMGPNYKDPREATLNPSQSDDKQFNTQVLNPSMLLNTEVDLEHNAASNARSLFVAAKKADEKAKRTEEIGERVVQQAEMKAVAAVEHAKAQHDKDSDRTIRKPLWFERFNWFITSEGLIVVAGKDAQQNEQLFRRYLRPQDAYVHADSHGAATCILRNPSNRPEASLDINKLRPSLEQAGTFAVCMSAQWRSNISTSAWWVYASQVSKTAPSGEYLPTGSFMIRGQKNFLPPAKLEMGMSVLFRVDDSCVKKHIHDRTIRAQLSQEVQPSDSTPENQDPSEKNHASAIESSSQQLSIIDTTKPALLKKSKIKGSTKPDKHKQNTDNKAEKLGVSGTRSKTSRTETRQKNKQKKRRHQEDWDVEDFMLSRIALGQHHECTSSPKVKQEADTGPAKSSKDVNIQNPAGLSGIGEDYGTQSALENLRETRNQQGELVDRVDMPDDLSYSPTNKTYDQIDTEKDEDDDGLYMDPKAGQLYIEINGEQYSGEKFALAALVSKPLPDDTLLHAIPMLAPYNALQGSYKYKTKLVPGPLKKGKAAKAVMEQFTLMARETGTDRERELLRKIPDASLIQSILGQVRVASTVAKKSNKQKNKKTKSTQSKASNPSNTVSASAAKRLLAQLAS